MLTNALDAILLWLSTNLPEYVDVFQPGLTRFRIQDLTEFLEFVLPEDFYQLYQWRNGVRYEPMKTLGPVFYFLPIDEVVSFRDWANSNILVSDDCIPRYKNGPVLPIIQSNCEYYALVLGRNPQEACVVLLDEIGDAVLRYDSISSMMKSIAQCFESGAYYLNEDGLVDEDIRLSSRIISNLNPKTCKEVTEDLQRHVRNLLDPASYEICLSAVEAARHIDSHEAITV
jgi:hypothetical protein